MTSLTAVDQVEVHVLVDNVTDSLSTVPHHVENEWSYLWRNGMKRLSGRCICCAAHGLSCLITAYRGERQHTILFDTGPEEEVFERNVSRLAVDLGTVKGIVLSHGHWDHAGGMLQHHPLVTRPFGRIATILPPDGDLSALYTKNQILFGTFLTREGARLREMTSLFERGQAKVVIDTVLPLEEVGKAHERLDSGHGRGKIILQVEQ